MASPAARGLLIGGRRLRVVPFLLRATGWFESWRWVASRADGRRGSAKHAVNPSMGARSAHPCASRFCAAPTPIRFNHHQRLLVPPGSQEKKDQIQRQKQKPELQPLLLLSPLLPPWV